MKRLNVHAFEAAIGVWATSSTLASVASMLDVTEADLDAGFGPQGIPDELAAHLRVLLWRQSIVMIVTPFFAGAVYIPALNLWRNVEWVASRRRQRAEPDDLGFEIFIKLFRMLASLRALSAHLGVVSGPPMRGRRAGWPTGRDGGRHD